MLAGNDGNAVMNSREIKLTKMDGSYGEKAAVCGSDRRSDAAR